MDLRPGDGVPGDAGRAAPTAVLIATCVSTLVVNANTSAVSILLPAISADTGTSLDTLQWAVTGYSLVGAAVIVTSGALGDVFGRRLVFLGGLGLFIASCVLIALSGSGAGVIAGRAIQGAAGATILACGMSLLSVSTSGAGQVRAVTLWGGASAVGAAAGPLVGGVLVDGTGWQGLFWIDAAIALACVPVTLKGVAESRDPDRSRSIDFAGTVLIATVLAPALLALSEGSQWGWTSAAVLGCFALAFVAAVAFVAVERRVEAPLVDLRLLKERVLIGATIGILLSAGVINGLMYLVSLYFQNPATLALSPLEAGLATLPATVGLIAVTPLVPRAVQRVGIGPVIALGFAAATGGCVLLVFVQGDWRYGAFVLPLVLLAAGLGLVNGPASSASTSSVSADDVGAASGISNMARYIGAASFTAAVATVNATVGSSRSSAGDGAADALAAGLSAACLLLAIACGVGMVLSVLAVRARRRRAGPEAYGAAAASHAHTVPVGDR
ncbi:MFS transporter [Streptomyces virginiae]|uniref:MFS transporter n=1 Tax=Streptomyces virginiae TaxID=1961 RepID=UPI002DD8F75B|nr:MFS transporter [Streptomyces virginiae]WSC74874.1 MFS transporter [Streptomyces virginiae]WSC82123.1 MFS transporter [Streptomyces virginiae]